MKIMGPFPLLSNSFLPFCLPLQQIYIKQKLMLHPQYLKLASRTPYNYSIGILCLLFFPHNYSYPEKTEPPILFYYLVCAVLT